jgi:hypothetical protein
MADFFRQLPTDERREALGVAAASSGRPMHLLDKDILVVRVLKLSSNRHSPGGDGSNPLAPTDAFKNIALLGPIS